MLRLMNFVMDTETETETKTETKTETDMDTEANGGEFKTKLKSNGSQIVNYKVESKFNEDCQEDWGRIYLGEDEAENILIEE